MVRILPVVFSARARLRILRLSDPTNVAHLRILTVLALTALVFRYKLTFDFPISFGVIMIGLFAPYAYLWNGGYTPRFRFTYFPWHFYH